MVDYQYEKEGYEAKSEADEEYVKNALEFIIRDLTESHNSYRYSLDRYDVIEILKKIIKGLK